MGLKGKGKGGKPWLKTLLRDESRFQSCLHYASWSRARREERRANQQANANGGGKGLERGFGVVMVELMLRKHALVTGAQTIEHFAKRWRELVAEQIARFPDAHTYIFLFDDETNVPQAKSKEQAKRRADPDKKLTPRELELLGERFSRLCNSDPHEFQRRIQQEFGVKARERNCSSFEIFMSKYMHTSGRREDEIEFATRCITAGAYACLGPGKRVLIDRGVWRDSFHRDSETDRYEGGEEPWSSMVRSFKSPDDFHSERSLGIHSLIQASADIADDDDDDQEQAEKKRKELQQKAHSASRAWILIDQFGVRRLQEMDGQHLVGEADLKIARYTRLFAGQNIYIVCHDTDELPILLLTIKDWIPTQGKVPGRIMLDLTIPSDDKPKPGRKEPTPAQPLPPLPGVIDMICLWRQVIQWFLDDFPQVRNPIEVFCLMLVLMKTDFVDNPPLLGGTRLWDAFKNWKLRKHLAGCVMTDGHMGAALPTSELEKALVSGEQFLQAKSQRQANNYMLALLMRDLTKGTRYHRQQLQSGLDRCPIGRQSRMLSFRENGIAAFIDEAYKLKLAKQTHRWPNLEWRRAEARRVEWNLAYWYMGDTAEGRQYADSMAADSDGKSIFGWEWTLHKGNPTSTPSLSASSAKDQNQAKTATPVTGFKRKSGCLGRLRPTGMIAKDSHAVISAENLRNYQRGLWKRQRMTSGATMTTDGDRI